MCAGYLWLQLRFASFIGINFSQGREALHV